MRSNSKNRRHFGTSAKENEADSDVSDLSSNSLGGISGLLESKSKKSGVQMSRFYYYSRENVKSGASSKQVKFHSANEISDADEPVSLNTTADVIKHFTYSKTQAQTSMKSRFSKMGSPQKQEKSKRPPMIRQKSDQQFKQKVKAWKDDFLMSDQNARAVQKKVLRAHHGDSLDSIQTAPSELHEADQMKENSKISTTLDLINRGHQVRRSRATRTSKFAFQMPRKEFSEDSDSNSLVLKEEKFNKQAPESLSSGDLFEADDKGPESRPEG